jgi:hypothetical protein
LLWQITDHAVRRAVPKLGSRIPINSAMIAITTRSSINVKPWRSRDPFSLPCAP